MLVPLRTKKIAGDEVRIPPPVVGKATVVHRYGKERAMLVHPDDFHRLVALDRFVEEAVTLVPVRFSREAERAHAEEGSPGEPITDPAAIAELFG